MASDPNNPNGYRITDDMRAALLALSPPATPLEDSVFSLCGSIGSTEKVLTDQGTYARSPATGYQISGPF